MFDSIPTHSLPASAPPENLLRLMPAGPDYDSWLFGLLLCIFATALTSLGLVLQKLSHTLNEKSQNTIVYYRQPWWIVGFTIFMLAQVVNLVPMSTAPQVMLSCLGATILIFNALLARLILQEDLHAFEVAVMLGVVCGVVMVICTTPIPPDSSLIEPSLRDMVGPLFSVRFLALAACVFVSLITLHFLVTVVDIAPHWPELGPLTWTLCAASCSGYTVNLFKAVAEFTFAWSATQPYQHWECYFIVVVAFCLGAMQVHCLNRALNLGRAMMVVPSYCALGLLSQLTLAEVIDFSLPESAKCKAIFAGGILMILVFIVMLARAKIAIEEEPEAEAIMVIKRTLSTTSVASWTQSFKAGSPIAGPAGDPDIEAQSPMAGTGTQKERRKTGEDLFPSDTSLPSPMPSPYSMEGTPLLRKRSLSSWDPEAFSESFQGRERVYSVAIIGVGIA